MQRLDKFLFEKNYFISREKARVAASEGRVFVDGKAREPAFKVDGSEKIEIKNEDKYVSRGAHKLAGAIKIFEVDLSGKVVLDIGASTGGFSQVALENGAKKVYALDVGKSQLDERLKADERVVDMSELDFRASQKLDDVDFIVSDLSFVSLKIIIPEILQRYQNLPMILLFKPQFECGREIAKAKKGVVRDRKLHEKLLNDFVRYFEGFRIAVCGLTFSPITGKSGNIEYLFYLNGEKNFAFDVKKVVSKAFETL